ncbi:MAG: RNA polymerase sigma factor [Colwellia sp.]
MSKNQNTADELSRLSTNESVLSVFQQSKSALKRFISGYLIKSEDIDDVCQETFLRTYKSTLQREISSPKSFMFRVAKNLIISDYRKASTKLNEYVEDIDLVDSIIDPENLENDILAQERLGVMFESIASLPNKCRQVVIMRKVYGFSTKEIAKRMNIAPSTVSNYITRGMCTYNDAVNKHQEDDNDNSVLDTSSVNSNMEIKS